MFGRLKHASIIIVAGAFLVAAAPPLEYPIVLTQSFVRTQSQQVPSNGQLSDGARIVVVYPDGRRRVLTEGFHTACDPEVSFDGTTLLFAGKRTTHGTWNIFEIGADGQGLRQITAKMGNCRSPVYPSTLYTLISDKPWHQIGFVSDLPGNVNEYGEGTATSLYSCRLDGTGRLRLTYAPSGVTDPFLMPDGRLVLSALTRRHPNESPAAALFGVNIDGTDLALFAGAGGGRVKRMPCVTSDGLAVFVESERMTADGAGFLSYVTVRRNHHAYNRVTKPEDGLFLYPSPLPDGGVLVSRLRPGSAASYEVGRLDTSSGRFECVFDDPEWDDIQAKRLGERPEPDGRSTSVLRRTGEVEDPSALESKGKPAEMPMGKLYCLSAHVSSLYKPEWASGGVIRRARFLEALPVRSREGDNLRQPGRTPAPPIARRLLGECPVEEDGSFNVQIPADIPVEVQLLPPSNGTRWGKTVVPSRWSRRRHAKPGGVREECGYGEAQSGLGRGAGRRFRDGAAEDYGGRWFDPG